MRHKENKFLNIGIMESRAFYDHETAAAIGVFKGFLTTDQFIKIAEELHDLREKNNSCKQLNNIEDMKVLTQDIQNWLNDVWFPKARKNGLKHFAFVIPKNVFGKMSMTNANKDESVRTGIEIEYFDTEASAKAWLRSK